MILIHFPEPLFRIKKENDKTFIFDSLRKLWLHLTEEEWVRQNFINYLIHSMNYPSTIIAIEKEITVYDLKKRFDILIYNRELKPWMMVECKAPTVSLNENVLQQVLRYNLSVPVEYIIITNGHQTIGWRKNGSNLEEIKEIPELI